MDIRMDSPDDMQTALWRFAEHRILTVAGRTGIIRHLSGSRSTIEETADSLKLDRLAAGKIIRALSSFGLLGCDGDRYFVHEPLACYFRGDEDDILSILEHSHHLYDMWGANLENWVRGEDVPRKQRSEEEIKAFGEAMQAMGTHVARQLTASIDLKNVKTMLDVGGGFGHYTKSIIGKNPEVEGTVIDTPETVNLARRLAEKDPAGKKLKWIEGDYHDTDWGTGYDLVLLANVLHQEREEQAKQMVDKGAAALKHGGRLAVVDFSIDDEKRKAPIGAIFAINMRSFGDTYSESDIRKWMEEAGLINIQRTELSSFRWLITGFRIW